MGDLSDIPMCARVDGKTGVWMRQRMMTGGSGDGWDEQIVEGVGLWVQQQEVQTRVDRRGPGGVENGRGSGDDPEDRGILEDTGGAMVDGGGAGAGDGS